MGYPRIEYNSISVDFDRHFNDADVEQIDITSENESSAGIIETLQFYQRDYIEAFKSNISAQFVQELRQWYEYVRDGSSFKLWLYDDELGLYIPFEGQIANTKDELAPTFTRNCVAYYNDVHTGLVTAVAANTPRFPAGKYGDGILIEGTSSNILTYSADFSHANWATSSITVSANTTETLDPLGTNTADKLAATSINAYIYQNTIFAINTDDCVVSVWLKAKYQITDEVVLWILDDAGNPKASVAVTPTPEWVRYSLAYTNDGADTDNWRFMIHIETSGTVIYAWGAQMEVGDLRTFPTSYIPTTAAGSELMPNSEDQYFSAPSAWTNSTFAAYNETGDLSLTANAATQWCYLPVASFPTTIGKRYRMIFTVANLVSTIKLTSYDGTQTYIASVANTINTVDFTAMTTGGILVVANTSTSSADFDDFSLFELGTSRLPEKITYAITNDLQIGSRKGTISFWMKNPWAYNEGGGGGNDPERRLINLFDAYLVLLRNMSSAFALQIYDAGGTARINATVTAASLTINTWHHIVIAYDLTIAQAKLYVDGTLLVTGSSSPFITKISTYFNIGCNNTPILHADAFFDEVVFYKDVKTLEWVTKEYARNKALGHAKNYWSAVKLQETNFNPILKRGGNVYDFQLKAKEVLT